MSGTRQSRRWPAMVRRAFLVLLAATTPKLHADCTVSAGSVVFGSYDVFNSSPLNGAGTLNVVCDPEISFTVKLGTGHGSYSQRRMSSSSDVLNYNLYTNVSRTIVWGDGTGGTGAVGGTGGDIDLTVYGSIPAGQNIPAGSYGDNIVVTVEF